MMVKPGLKNTIEVDRPITVCAFEMGKIDDPSIEDKYIIFQYEGVKGETGTLAIPFKVAFHVITGMLKTITDKGEE